jgi:hypothetical protein
MAPVYQTATLGEAQIRVAIVSNRGEADLLVNRVSSWGLANGDGLWYVTKNKQDATVYVYFSSVGMAQVKVCFVDSYGEAGWLTENKYKGQLR